jgi:hypothetical protein
MNAKREHTTQVTVDRRASKTPDERVRLLHVVLRIISRLRMHLVKQLDCRSSESEFDSPRGRRRFQPGAIVHLGESYLRTVGIGVRIPVAPPGRAEDRGLSLKLIQPHGHLLVRPSIQRPRRLSRGTTMHGRDGRSPRFWDRSSPGRAPDRQSGGSRFDSDRFHEGTSFAAQAQRAGSLFGTQEMASAILASSSRHISRGGSSKVESEAAKLVMGVRFPSTALPYFLISRASSKGKIAGLRPDDAGSSPAARSRLILFRAGSLEGSALCKSARPGSIPGWLSARLPSTHGGSAAF